VMRACSLLDRGPLDREAIASALSGHLCRCTGYTRILDAIETAAEAWADGGHIARHEPRQSDFFGERF